MKLLKHAMKRWNKVIRLDSCCFGHLDIRFNFLIQKYGALHFFVGGLVVLYNFWREKRKDTFYRGKEKMFQTSILRDGSGLRRMKIEAHATDRIPEDCTFLCDFPPPSQTWSLRRVRSPTHSSKHYSFYKKARGKPSFWTSCCSLIPIFVM